MPQAPHTGLQAEPIRKELLNALIAAGYTQKKACKIIKMSPNTAIAIKRAKAPSDGTADKIKKELSKKYWYKADRIIDGMDDIDILSLSGKDKAVTGAILVDKALLLDGQPTQRVHHTVSVTELDRQIEKAKKDLEETRQQAIAAGLIIDVEPNE